MESIDLSKTSITHFDWHPKPCDPWSQNPNGRCELPHSIHHKSSTEEFHVGQPYICLFDQHYFVLKFSFVFSKRFPRLNSEEFLFYSNTSVIPMNLKEKTIDILRTSCFQDMAILEIYKLIFDYSNDEPNLVRMQVLIETILKVTKIQNRLGFMSGSMEKEFQNNLPFKIHLKQIKQIQTNGVPIVRNIEENDSILYEKLKNIHSYNLEYQKNVRSQKEETDPSIEPATRELIDRTVNNEMRSFEAWTANNQTCLGSIVAFLMSIYDVICNFFRQLVEV